MSLHLPSFSHGVRFDQAQGRSAGRTILHRWARGGRPATGANPLGLQYWATLNYCVTERICLSICKVAIITSISIKYNYNSSAPRKVIVRAKEQPSARCRVFTDVAFAYEAVQGEPRRRSGGAEVGPSDMDFSPLTNNKRFMHLSIMASKRS
jgi:hypothetical protein